MSAPRARGGSVKYLKLTELKWCATQRAARKFYEYKRRRFVSHHTSEGGTEMAAPWTAAQAASDDVSKKMLIQDLQEKAGEDFVNENKIGGAITSVVKRVTKEQVVDRFEIK